jgi:hypothetical protein
MLLAAGDLTLVGNPESWSVHLVPGLKAGRRATGVLNHDKEVAQVLRRLAVIAAGRMQTCCD